MVTTNNMGMVLPSVDTLTPEYVTLNTDAFETIDAHNHTTGLGVKVPTSGLNINADLDFASNNATSLRSSRYSEQSTAFTAGSDINAVYSLNGELVWRDADGNNVQITDAGGLNFASLGTIGGDFGQPGVLAAATYSDTTKYFAWTRSAGVGAGMAMSNLKLTYPVAGQQAVTLSTPTGVTAYEMILPAGIAAAAASVITINTDGTMAFTKTLADITITDAILTDADLTGATFTDGTIAGTTTLSFGTTWSGTSTWSSAQTFSSAPTFSTVSNKVLAVDGSGGLFGISSTGTDNIVKSTSPTVFGLVASTTLNFSNSLFIQGVATYAHVQTFTSAPVFSSVTASEVLAVDASKNLTSIAVTGTGSVVRGTSPTIASPTITGTVAGGATYTAITVNGGYLTAPAIACATTFLGLPNFSSLPDNVILTQQGSVLSSVTYSEGTYTGTLGSFTYTGTGTVSAASTSTLAYQRIGNICYVTGSVYINAAGAQAAQVASFTLTLPITRNGISQSGSGQMNGSGGAVVGTVASCGSMYFVNVSQTTTIQCLAFLYAPTSPMEFAVNFQYRVVS